jgi:hypothetical protein
MLAEVDVVRVALLDPADELQNAEAMSRLRGADEVVVADVQLLPEIVVRPDDAVRQLDRGDAFLGGGSLDLLPMLVRAGEKAHVVAHPPPMAGDHVRNDVLVHVPDVRIVVDVVNGGG